MPQQVRIPEPLRELANNQEFVEVNGATVGEVIAELQLRFPSITKHVLDKNGELFRFAHIYVNDDNIQSLQSFETPLHHGDRICIVPALIDNRTAVAAIEAANRLREARSSLKN